MILAAIMPGPHEPSLHINSFLEQLVAELNKLWKGVEIKTSEGKNTLLAAVICNSSDIPASRKVGGFVGHGANKGCSRCLKSFSSPSRTFGDKADYSGLILNHGLVEVQMITVSMEWNGSMHKL